MPLRVQTALHARRLLDATLAERGWPASVDVHVLARRLDPVPEVDDVRIVAAPDAAWLGRFRNGTTPPLARDLLMRHDRVGFAEVRRAGRTVAIGRGTVDDGWLGVTAVEVAAEARRQGLATAVMHALWRWGRDEHGATRTYLHVEDSNDAALLLYRRMGYWLHHVHRYRAEPPRHPDTVGWPHA
jgi:ribosomal protein S18 acetylase RimI-like enzyme